MKLFLGTTHLFHEVCNTMGTPMEEANELRNTGSASISSMTTFADHDITDYNLEDTLEKVNTCVARVQEDFWKKINDTQTDILQYTDEVIEGAGSYGIVLWNSPTMVRKISKDAKSDMDALKFPLEFCIPHITQSPYIANVKDFNPFEVSTYLTSDKQLVDDYKIDPSRTYSVGDKKYVASFEVEKCQKIDWRKFQGSKEMVLYDMIYAANHVHQSAGISMLDIKGDNIMLCDGQFKFMDMGLARFFKDETTTTMVFGTPSHRSPWANLFMSYFFKEDKISNPDRVVNMEELRTLEKFPDWLKDLFDSEYEAYDFWSVGILFMRQFCDLDKSLSNLLVTLRKNFLKEYLELVKNKKKEKNQKTIEALWNNKYRKILIDKISECKLPVNTKVEELLKKLLEINPEKRLKNVKDIVEDMKQKKIKKIKKEKQKKNGCFRPNCLKVFMKNSKKKETETEKDTELPDNKI